jgi:hypothetical protein
MDVTQNRILSIANKEIVVTLKWSLLNFGTPITPKFAYGGQIISYLLTINPPSTNIGGGNGGP